MRKQLDRRDFLKTSATAALAGTALLSGCGKAPSASGPYVQTGKTFRWKMATSWPPNFPILYTGAEAIAKRLQTLSGGRLEIQVSGDLVPAMQVFDSVGEGTVQMGHASAYYWAGKTPAAQFFTTVPFGMNAQQANAWLYHGGGQALWDETYAPFNIVSMPAGNTGVQMGGWFNKEINSLQDLKGLKMRIPGLGGKVIAEAGGSVTLSAASEIYTNLERGVIDATEWVGPYHDYIMGLHKIARYYYYPGWHEPGSVLELMINREAWAELPEDLRQLVRAVAAQANVDMLSEFEAQNAKTLRQLVDEEGVQLRRFPDDVMAAFKRYTTTVLEDLAARDPQSANVYRAYRQFHQQMGGWADISEKAYYSFTG